MFLVSSSKGESPIPLKVIGVVATAPLGMFQNERHVKWLFFYWTQRDVANSFPDNSEDLLSSRGATGKKNLVRYAGTPRHKKITEMSHLVIVYSSSIKTSYHSTTSWSTSIFLTKSYNINTKAHKILTK